MSQPTTHITELRKDFPSLNQLVHGRELVYFDNAATSQKPQQVIDRMTAYYAQENSNVHRGVHYLSQKATDAYEHTRKLVQALINAPHEHEVIFTKGTTEGINLVAHSFGQRYLSDGDEIILSGMEHHSNIVPWQLVAEQTGAKIKVIPVTDAGELDMDAYASLLNERTKIVSVVYISNSLGTINPVQDIIRLAHERNIPVLLDAAQAVPHQSVDVQALDVDFFVFSGHKMFAPTGVGILYGKESWLNEMPPFLGGGDMIDRVTFEKTTFNSLPHKFEAGTPPIAEVIGLGAGIEYINQIGYDAISAWEHELLAYGTEQLQQIEGLRIIGTAEEKASVISFLLHDIHPYDAGTILDQLGIAIRTGHHCTQPLMDRFEVPGTMRASFAFYNTKEEIDRLVAGIAKVKQMFGQ